MKSLIKVLIVMMMLTSLSVTTAEKASAQAAVSFQVFYDQLSPYGSWVHNPRYGYVWAPSVGGGFAPYSTAGHWVYSQYGWMWVSDYPWGWAPFHYGSWYFDPIYGWVWVPDTVWGPAWVVWHRAPGYYGWAPIEPGININIVLGGRYHPPATRWIFVNEKHIASRDIDRYYGPRGDNEVLLKKSTVINNTYVDKTRNVKYIAGPDRESASKAMGAPVKQVAVRENDKPGQSVGNDEVRIYRPAIQKNTGGKQPAPKEVKEMKDLKPLNAKDQDVKKEPVQDNKPKASPTQERDVKEAPEKQQPREPVKQEQREPVKQEPREPVRQEPREPVKQEPKAPEQQKESPQQPKMPAEESKEQVKDAEPVNVPQEQIEAKPDHTVTTPEKEQQPEPVKKNPKQPKQKPDKPKFKK